MITFYHGDNDGKCAGAIVAKAFPQTRVASVNYNKPFPLDSVEPDEAVFIVDYSLSVDDMERLLERTPNVTWIDHHRTAIERFDTYPAIKTLPGIRNVTAAGCELTWLYLFPNLPPPRVVALIGDYDTWTFKYGDTSRALHYGLNTEDIRPHAALWTDLLDTNHEWSDSSRLDDYLVAGWAILKWKKQWSEGYIRAFSYPTLVDGHPAVAVNVAKTGSDIFGERAKTIPVMLIYVHDGAKVSCSLFSEGQVDVGRIAEKFGGGGHPGAAGFTMPVDVFFQTFPRVS